MAAYLAAAARTRAMRTLADLIAFNDAHCEDELRWFGQELFDVAEATTGLDDPAYRAARALCLDVTRARWDRPDPGRWPPRRDRRAGLRRLERTGGGRRLPEHLGPDRLTDDGRPGGVWLSAGFLGEPTLLGFAFDLEAADRRAAATALHRRRSRPSRRMPGCARTPIAERRRFRREDLPADV